VITEYLRRGRQRGGDAAAAKQARYYFGLDANPSPSDIAAIAAQYPVFRITYDTRPAEPPGGGTV
jgi:hypothetical protein